MKSIKEWTKLATVQIEASRSYAEINKVIEERNIAIEQVKAYEKYKQILKPQSIKNLKKFLAKNTPSLMLVCLHGDMQNVCVQYAGKWCENMCGEVYDTDSDDTRAVWCTKHEGSVVHLCELVEDTEDIEEYKEIVKLLEKYA